MASLGSRTLVYARVRAAARVLALPSVDGAPAVRFNTLTILFTHYRRYPTTWLVCNTEQTEVKKHHLLSAHVGTGWKGYGMPVLRLVCYYTAFGGSILSRHAT